ncbi:NAD(P)-dependent dehydrogenase (short-subunit alcohol dehydrogenase family) [Bacillus ectoiniformans]|uniref:SDR family oxidoreductase n=1 Tax=Bacillus ectoiniformans TaxID=1494429 RepID=UPI00195D8B80|nr:SDR family oxidoreductase [Bacillus ectoiniformans]MBM7647564.1 NAD(P)-dependent dehydrogenase (short-subunit alcohol dehydrogenase family) [Bacillus ectoiniformans]
MSQDQNQTKQTFPKQHQEEQPGKTEPMSPQPDHIRSNYKGSDKLKDKVALITGADSGIGRSAAIHFAREGADLVISYLNEHEDAQETKKLVEQEGRKCLLISGDLGTESFCKEVVQKTIDEFGKLDVLVNNAAEQHPQNSILDITAEQMEQTFRTNFFGYFYMTKAALPHLKQGASIINTASITAYEGNETLIDYSSTKGAIVSFTRAMSNSLAKDGIRVNGVAPGPIWTPLIPSTFSSEKVSHFGANTPFGRAGQPSELGPAYVFLASEDSSYISGQMIHINGGKVING